MAERADQEDVTAAGEGPGSSEAFSPDASPRRPHRFELRETVTYPNGGSSAFYEDADASTALIVDDGICRLEPGQPPFDYAQITSKQNEYVARNQHVYRFMREDVDGDLQKINRFLNAEDEPGGAVSLKRAAERADTAEPSPLEAAFEEHFENVYGPSSARYLQREYVVADVDGHTWYLDYVVQTKEGLLGVEENGVTYHHPQLIGEQRYRNQLLKQNSCQRAGIKLYRFSTEDLRFTERLEDDIRSYFGGSVDAFVDDGVLVDRPVGLYEHQEGALDEIARRREQGVGCFLLVLPTGSGKSRVVEEDLARFAPTRPGFKALVLAPSTAIVDDWQRRLSASLPAYAPDVVVATYGWANRHYTEYAPDHFDYIVVDEAHHAVAPALKRTIQHFAPAFLVGLTATDKRPDKRALESVFGSYRVGLSLAQAMERGIVARARAFRIETNVDLSQVRVNGRDFVNADLERTLRVTSRNQLIVDVLREYFCDGDIGRRQGVVFCASVRHADDMARLLNEAGISARSLSGQTKHPERVMDEFRRGEVRFLCSCQMISEGWDWPELGVLVMARPTLSRVLYLQQLGRGLRRTPTKSDVYVIDVVDEYGAMATPCSLHTIFSNPCYVPFGDILKRDWKPGDWIEVDGVFERVERIVEVDAVSYAEKYEGWLSTEQLARALFVGTGTVNEWVRRGKVQPSATLQFGSKPLYLFSPDDAEAIRVRLGIPVHSDETIREDFLAFLAERDYSMSYKMPFLLAFLGRMDPATGDARTDDVLSDYVAFYRDRLERGLPVDRAGCPYTLETLGDRAFMRRSMLVNPFEKFERKRFMYQSRDLGLISLNHALLARLTADDLEAVRTQMRDDLAAYYARV